MIQKFIRDESGATAIEYGLIAAGIAVTIITVLTSLGGKLESTLTRVKKSLKLSIYAAREPARCISRATEGSRFRTLGGSLFAFDKAQICEHRIAHSAVSQMLRGQSYLVRKKDLPFRKHVELFLQAAAPLSRR